MLARFSPSVFSDACKVCEQHERLKSKVSQINQPNDTSSHQAKISDASTSFSSNSLPTSSRTRLHMVALTWRNWMNDTLYKLTHCITTLYLVVNLCRACGRERVQKVLLDCLDDVRYTFALPTKQTNRMFKKPRFGKTGKRVDTLRWRSL